MNPNMVTKLVMPTRLFAWEQKGQSPVEGLTMPTKRKRIRNPSKSKRKRDAEGRAITVKTLGVQAIPWTDSEDKILVDVIRNQPVPVSWIKVSQSLLVTQRKVTECLKRWVEIKGRRPKAKKKKVAPTPSSGGTKPNLKPTGPTTHYM
jgi:hypothetical protein